MALVPSVLFLVPVLSTPAQIPAERVAAFEETLRNNQALFASRPELSADGRQQVLQNAAESLANATYVVHMDGSTELRAQGPAYQAIFQEGGWHFAASSPEGPQRVSFELVSVGRTGSVRDILSATAPQRAAGQVIEYQRGGGLVERYQLLAEGIEQSFEFAEPVPGTGDLVVRLRIDSALAAPMISESRDGLRFGGGDVRIGGITGIGADGETSEGWMNFDGDSLELVLSAEFVEQASYPMILDPLIGSEIVLFPSTGLDYRNMDVAYDATNDRYLLIAQRRVMDIFSGEWGPYELSALPLDGNGVSLGGSGYGGATIVLTNPAVGNLSDTDTFLFVCERTPDTGGPADLSMFTLPADGSDFGTSFTPLSTAGDQRLPDVCGDPVEGFNDALVIWQESGSGIQGALVDVPASPVDPTLAIGPFAVSANGGDSWPAVSKGLASPGIALVVWQRGNDIFGRVVDYLGNLLSGEEAITATPAADFQPDVDGDGAQFMVAYESGPGGARDIKCVPVTWDGAVGVGAETVAASGNNILASVGYSGKAFLLAWTNLTTLAIQAKTVFPDCSTCEKTVTVSSGPGFGRFNTEIVTNWSSSLVDDDEAVIVWEQQDFSGVEAPGDRALQFFDVQASGASSEATINSVLAPNPPWLLPGQTSGPVLGQVWDPIVIHSTFLPDAVFDLFILRLGGPLDIPLPPLGTLIVNIVAPGSSFLFFAGDPLSIPLPLDCSLIGIPLTGQVLSDNLAGTQRFTNGLSVVLGTS